MDAARGANNDLRTILKCLHIIADAGSANTCVALDAHEVADGDDDLLNLLRKLTCRGKNQCLALLDVGIDLLKNRDGECGCLASSGLRLRNNIVTLEVLGLVAKFRNFYYSPLITGIIARCWIADGRSKP
jgi:hypothetical protein